MSDLAMMTVEQVSSMVEKGAVSPAELVEACLKRIEAYNPAWNAYVFVMAEEARAAARKAEREIQDGHYRGRLHGIPVALKDLYYTKGIPTTGGSEVMRGFVPTDDATVTRRLREAGAILMGKTNTHEFAFGPTTEESCFGPSCNPWNPAKISGGSSGGSGVAAAAGMAYVAMGTDTGGSVRIPAAMCGVVGFKPTVGLASLYGIIALSFHLDHPGPLCRSVADAAITMDAITGTDPLDPCPYAAPGDPTHFYEGLTGAVDLRGTVIGVPVNFFFDKTDEEVERVFREAIARLKDLGAEVRELVIPALDLVTDASTCIMFSEAAYLHRERYPAQKEKYQAGVAARLDQGRAFSAVQYIQALEEQKAIMAAWEKALQDVDAVAVPTCPVEAFDRGLAPPWNVVTRGREEPGKSMCTYHTRLANLTGAPALSLPAGLTGNRLPVGLMIMGRRGDDLGVLRIGAAYEKHNPYPQLEMDPARKSDL